MMGRNEHVELYARLIDAVNAGRLGDLAALCTVDLVDHQPLPGQSADLDGLRHGYAMLRDAFPDFQIEVADVLVEGDRLVARSSWHGTHNGLFLGIPPTDARFSATSIEILRVAEGRIAERWAQIDLLGILQQLGVLPPPEQQGGSTRID